MPTKAFPDNFSDKRSQLPERVQAYQQKMKSYSDHRRAVRPPQFRPGQTVRVFNPSHHNKLHSTYSEPHRIHTQLGPATYQLDDGRRWNAMKLTKTSRLPPVPVDLPDPSWDSDEDEDTRHVLTYRHIHTHPLVHASTRAPEATEHHIQASVSDSPPPEGSSGQPVLRSPGGPDTALPEPGLTVEPDPSFTAAGLGSLGNLGHAVQPEHSAVPGPSGPPPAVSPGPAGPEPGSAVNPGVPAVAQGHSIPSKSAGALPSQPSDAVFHPPRASTPLGSRPSSTLSTKPEYHTPPTLSPPPPVPARPPRKKRVPTKFEDYVMAVSVNSGQAESSDVL
ncbi:unnamed protein product [Ixodes pacificus]